MSGRYLPGDWDDYVRALGLSLQRRRVELGLTQEDVAHNADLTRSHYQQLEKGQSRPGVPANPSLRTLVSLADALGVDLHDLIPQSVQPSDAENDAIA